mmetsp:Transcript_8879/g.29616  ORF Transcript_8879/g.29616 Transcript_8879/m.29616 type:complete len:629 (+) Transcript_8879:800-2686(+)
MECLLAAAVDWTPSSLVSALLRSNSQTVSRAWSASPRAASTRVSWDLRTASMRLASRFKRFVVSAFRARSAASASTAASRTSMSNFSFAFTISFLSLSRSSRSDLSASPCAFALPPIAAKLVSSASTCAAADSSLLCKSAIAESRRSRDVFVEHALASAAANDFSSPKTFSLSAFTRSRAFLISPDSDFNRVLSLFAFPSFVSASKARCSSFAKAAGPLALVETFSASDKALRSCSTRPVRCFARRSALAPHAVAASRALRSRSSSRSVATARCSSQSSRSTSSFAAKSFPSNSRAFVAASNKGVVVGIVVSVSMSYTENSEPRPPSAKGACVVLSSAFAAAAAGPASLPESDDTELPAGRTARRTAPPYLSRRVSISTTAARTRPIGDIASSLASAPRRRLGGDTSSFLVEKIGFFVAIVLLESLAVVCRVLLCDLSVSRVCTLRCNSANSKECAARSHLCSSSSSLSNVRYRACFETWPHRAVLPERAAAFLREAHSARATAHKRSVSSTRAAITTASFSNRSCDRRAPCSATANAVAVDATALVSRVSAAVTRRSSSFPFAVASSCFFADAAAVVRDGAVLVKAWPLAPPPPPPSKALLSTSPLPNSRSRRRADASSACIRSASK